MFPYQFENACRFDGIGNCYTIAGPSHGELSTADHAFSVLSKANDRRILIASFATVMVSRRQIFR